MDLQKFYKERDKFFLEVSPNTRGCLVFFVFIGLFSFVWGMIQGDYTRTWGILLFNTMFFYAIAIGGTALGHMQDIIGAEWGRPIKRLHESLTAFLPLASGLLIAFLVCIKFDIFSAGKVYIWIADPEMLHHFHGKDVWLQPNFMFVRDIISILGILCLSRWHHKLTTAPDHAFLEGHYEKGLRLGEEARRILRYWSAPVLVLYSLLFSVLAFDLMMSLAPTWISTLWAGWQFAVMMQTLFAFLLIILFALKKSHVGKYIQRQQFHDIGKLLFGFTAFYAYLTYAHVLTYWYTNMPEETSYLITRMESPWLKYVIIAPFTSFLIPFILMVPKASKWTSFVAIPTCVLVLAAQWINMMLVVMPETTKVTEWYMPWIEMGVFLGFLGAFLLSFIHRNKKVPMISLADPLLPSSLNAHH